MGLRRIRFRTTLAFFLALGAVLWMVMGRFAYHREIYQQITGLEEKVETLGELGREKQKKLAKWYNYSLSRGKSGLRAAYYRILDFGDGMMAVLEVPELNLRLPVFHGNSGPVGHDPATPLPVGGRGNHTVLILTEAYEWTQGMTVHIDCLGERFTYRVESCQVMPLNWSPEQPKSEEKELLTLLFDRGRTRTLIRCVRCRDLAVRETDHTGFQWAAILALASPLGCVLPALLSRQKGMSGEQGP